MAETTGIAWTDHTWNPWRGCSKVVLPDGTPHPGCQSCYAERMSKRNPATLGIWGDDGTRVVAVTKTFANPLRWNKAGGGMVFVDSMGDFFEDRDDLAKPRREAFGIMDQCDRLTFQVLTKRPENVRWMWVEGAEVTGAPSLQPHRPNVWLLYSASNQATLDYGAPLILDCRDLVPVVGISLEPMLGPTSVAAWLPGGRWKRGDIIGDGVEALQRSAGLGWVIIGVESNGPKVGRLGDFANESEWWDAAADVVSQCRAAGVPCFVKQGPRDGRVVHRLEDFPAACRVREFPTGGTERLQPGGTTAAGFRSA